MTRKQLHHESVNHELHLAPRPFHGWVWGLDITTKQLFQGVTIATIEF